VQESERCGACSKMLRAVPLYSLWLKPGGLLI
jgi:hypothetical protein